MELNNNNFFTITKINITTTKIEKTYSKLCSIELDHDIEKIIEFNKHYPKQTIPCDSIFENQTIVWWIELDNEDIFPVFVSFYKNIIYFNIYYVHLSKELKEGSTIFLTQKVYSTYKDKEKLWNLLANENNLTLDKISIITKIININ